MKKTKDTRPDSIDTLIHALWLEEGLSKNTLEAYRRDLTLYAAWLKTRPRPLELEHSTELDLQAYFVTQHSKT